MMRLRNEDDDDRERVYDIGGYLTAPSSMKHETEPPGGGGRGFENDDDKERVNDCRTSIQHETEPPGDSEGMKLLMVRW